ncbi:MAG: phenylpyruvate tautomerase MIF-related protein [bacterium]|nr:phenylpyruvate tautomerase MIF-related protein [bacterium]
MPFISITTNVTLTTQHEVRIKSETARIMNDIAGKPEEWLMIAIQPATLLFFQGTSDPRTAYVEIKYIGAFAAELKEKIVKGIAKLLQEEIGVSPDRLYVHYAGSSAADWAWSGTMLSCT